MARWFGWMLRSGAYALAAIVPVALQREALAHPAEHPRTPVVWNDTACMELVDRSIDSIYVFDYDIPFEDTEPFEFEVPDSRTHQFFAFCRPTHPYEYHPAWVTRADVDVAHEHDLVDGTDVTDDEVLELASAWDGCWFRITEDDERRPISFDMADEPVVWDTTEAPTGTYVIAGYTHEPAFNFFWPRYGNVVRVFDGGLSHDLGPAAAITSRGQNVCFGEAILIEGCIDAAPGSSMTILFAQGRDSQDRDWKPVWNPILVDIPIDADTFAIEWHPPEDLQLKAVMIRADVRDPQGRTYTSYQQELDLIIPPMATPCDGPPDDMGGEQPESRTGTDTTITKWEPDDPSGDLGAPERHDGCTCSSPAPVPVAPSLLLLAGATPRRRTKRSLSSAKARDGGQSTTSNT